MQASDGQHAAWMMTLGDVFFLHFEKFSRVPGSALRGIEDWLADNERMLRLTPDWRVSHPGRTLTNWRCSRTVPTGC